jgi:putative membrane protein
MVALQRAQHPKVKEFAQLETAEPETVADVLKAINAAADMTAAPQVGGEAPGLLQKLKESQRSIFDREYIQAQLNGHQELFKIQEQYLGVRHLVYGVRFVDESQLASSN